MTRAITLIRIDLMRLRPAVILTLLGIAGGLVVFYRLAPALRAAGVVAGPTAVGHAAIASAIAYALAAATVFTVTLTAHLVAAERASGVLAAVLVAPVSRKTWLAARAASVVVRGVGVVAAIALVAWLAGWLLLDLGDVKDGKYVIATAAEARDAVLRGIAYQVPPLLAAGTLALGLGTLATGPAMASSLAPVALLALSFAGAASPRIGPWLFTSYIPVIGSESAILTGARVAQGFADAVFEPTVLARSVVVCAATAALGLALAMAGTSREKLAWRE